MKILIFTLSILLLSLNCIPNKSKKADLEIRVNLNNRLDSHDFHDLTGDFYSINIDLENITDSTFSFWAMTCSWEVNWISNSSRIYLFNAGCDSNIPHIIKIEKNKIFSYKGIIRVIEKSEDSNSYKLGFTLIKENEIHDLSSFSRVLLEKGSQGNSIIWSKPFKLKL